MESDARPPEKLSNIGPMDQNWKIWKKMFLNYMKLTGGIYKPDDVRVAWLKNLIGHVGLEALETLSFDNPRDEERMVVVMEKLDLFFDPPKNEVQERYKFFSKSKKKNESYDDYVDSLRGIAKHCNFKDQMESLIRDAVILDIKDKHLRELIFEEEDIDLECLKIICKTYEINTARMKDVSKEVIEDKTKPVEKKFVPSAPIATQGSRYPCSKCGQRHPQRQCPAFRNFCSYCKQMNHFVACCPVAKAKMAETSSTTSTTNPHIKKENNIPSPFQLDKNSKVTKEDQNKSNIYPVITKHEDFIKVPQPRTSQTNAAKSCNDLPPPYSSITVPQSALYTTQSKPKSGSSNSNYRSYQRKQKPDTDCVIS